MKESTRVSIIFSFLLLLFSQFTFSQTNSFTSKHHSITSRSKTIFHRLGNRNIPVQIIQYGEDNGIYCINLHDNESTSVGAAMNVLAEKGGTLIRIQNSGQRIIKFRLDRTVFGFDPNRMFSREGIEASLKKSGKISKQAVITIEKFAARVLQLLPDSLDCLIALHNNTEGFYSIKSYQPGGEYETDADDVYQNPEQDEDDIVFTTDGSIFRKMASHGYNSILQDNENARKDGSLSVYFGERNRSYVNIETEHGKLSLYREMLKTLLNILEKKL